MPRLCLSYRSDHPNDMQLAVQMTKLFIMHCTSILFALLSVI
jgi:hypothetical protein